MVVAAGAPRGAPAGTTHGLLIPDQVPTHATCCTPHPSCGSLVCELLHALPGAVLPVTRSVPCSPWWQPFSMRTGDPDCAPCNSMRHERTGLWENMTPLHAAVFEGEAAAVVEQCMGSVHVQGRHQAARPASPRAGRHHEGLLLCHPQGERGGCVRHGVCTPHLTLVCRVARCCALAFGGHCTHGAEGIPGPRFYPWACRRGRLHPPWSAAALTTPW